MQKKELEDSKYIDIHAEAMKNFDNAQAPIQEEREQCLEDRRFYSIAGAQWEGDLGEQFENKPKFEVNKIHLSVMKIISEYRNNRITVDFVSDSNDQLSQTCDMLYRADENDSIADEAYDNAFEEAVGGGFGAWRLTTDYEDEEDEDNDHQRVKILPIYDADSCVFFDPSAKRQDKRDAKYCFVLSSMSVEAYENEYGFAPSSIEKDVDKTEFDWFLGDDSVYVAEYYKIVYKKKTINIYEDIQGNEIRYSSEELEKDPQILENLLSSGHVLVRTKNVKKQRVEKYIVDGSRVLEDCGLIAGKYIPIVPMYGKRWFVDNIERCMGHVRLCKDVQRLKNIQLSKLGEISASSNIEKPILTPEQVAGHEQTWADDNVQNYPYLLINPMKDAMGNELPSQPLGYTKSPVIPPAMAALLQLTDQDIRELLGSQQGGEEIRSNLSGDAVQLVQQKLDMQTYIYMSNMAKSMKRCGEIWLSMTKDVIIEENRKVKGMSEAGNIEYLEVNKLGINESTNEVEYFNDLSKAKLDVQVSVAPSTTTKRQSTIRSIERMMMAVSDPELQNVLGSTAILNMEGEGIDDIKKYVRRKLIRLGAIEPDQKELEALQREMQSVQPSSQDIYLQAEAQKSEAQAIKAKADTAKTLAQTEETQAKTAQILSEIDQKDRESAISAAKEINNLINT